MSINIRKDQRGFIGWIIAAIAVAIIVVTVLAATGVIDLPRFGSGSSCIEIREACEESCGNDSRCKNDCFIAYQNCIADEVRDETGRGAHPR